MGISGRPRFMNPIHPAKFFADVIIKFVALIPVQSLHGSVSRNVLPEEYIYYCFHCLMLDGIQLQSFRKIVLYDAYVLIACGCLGQWPLQVDSNTFVGVAHIVVL
jgi:hypothetical protein